MRRFLTGLAIVALAGGLAATPAVASTHSIHVTVRLHLSSTVLTPGQSETVTVTFINKTGKDVAYSCGSGVGVGITNAQVAFNPVVATPYCPKKLRPGVTSVHVELVTTYQTCHRGAVNTSIPPTPRCPALGMPVLPDGVYHTDVVNEGFAKGVLILPAPITVTLTG